MKRTGRVSAQNLLIALVSLCLAAAFAVSAASLPMYLFLKGRARGWDGRIFRVDPELGYSPMPGRCGSRIMPYRTPIPACFDKNGFRAAAKKAPPPSSGPRILALGCSFTFGEGCAAEDAYPSQLQTLVGGEAFNAGVPGYGLAQMLLLARRLIPELKPSHVLVQYSPWLPERASTPFAPAHYGKVPIPYFTRLAASKTLSLHPPPFPTRAFGPSVSGYRWSRIGPADYLRFALDVGIPLVSYDILQTLRFRLKLVAGLEPAPERDRLAIMDSAYGEIASLCRRHGCAMTVVALGPPAPEDLARLTDILKLDVLNPWQSMLAASGGSRPAFERAFHHWGGTPPRCIDTHPNREAHRLIAEHIASSVFGRSARR